MSNETVVSKKRVVSFSQNWNNKLMLDYFSTIRLEQKKYYTKNTIFAVHLYSPKVKKKVLVGKARLVASSAFTLDQISDSMSYLDAGMCREDLISMLKTMYRKKVDNILTHRFNLLVFQFTQKYPVG